MVEVKDSPADRSSQKSARANVTISVQPAAVVADNSQVKHRYYIGLRLTRPRDSIYRTICTGTRSSPQFVPLHIISEILIEKP